MPQVFAPIFALIQAIGAAAGTVAGALGLTGSQLLGIGLSVGLTVYSYLTQPKAQEVTPEDVQNQTKNSTSWRVRHYGRVKISGVWVFAESVQGDFHKVLALGSGELDAVEEVWVEDKFVTLNAFGAVQTAPWKWGDGDYESHLLIQYRMGLPTETYYAVGLGTGPFSGQWTPDHRGDGVSSLYARQSAVKQEDISDIFPGLTAVNYRVVARASKVLDPVSGVIGWTENAADIVRDYMTHKDGARIPASLFSTPLAQAGWIASHNRCAEAVPTKAGGTEMRYRIWGSYAFNERPADVFARMFAVCDGRVVPTPDGGFYLDVGHWYEPTVILDEEAITGLSGFKSGKNINESANSITAVYTSPFHDYQSTDAEAWVDDDDIAARGEISTDRAFLMAPSHGQCRRLMKLGYYRATPRWSGAMTFNLRALAAFGERYVRIRYPLFGIDEVFEVLDFRFNIGEGGILTGVTLQLQSLPAAAFEWDAATEEGTPPANDEIVVDNTIPVPSGFDFVMGTRVISGQTVPVGVASFTAPTSAALLPEVQYRKGTLGEWMQIPVVSGETSGQSGILEDGEPYQARMRFVTITGRQGDWTPIKDLTPVTDPIAPAAITSFAAANEAHLGNVKLQFAVAADPHLSRIKIYRVPVGSTLDRNAHRIATLVPAGGTFQYIDGDATRTNLITDPGFSDPSKWTVNGDWSIAGGQAVKSATSATSQVYQAWAAQPQAGDVVRWQAALTANNDAATLALFNRSSVGSSSAPATSASLGSGTGNKRGTLTIAAALAYVGVTASSGRTASIDRLDAYVQTAACAPAGDFNYYAEPFNISNKPGPLTSAVAATII